MKEHDRLRYAQESLRVAMVEHNEACKKLAELEGEFRRVLPVGEDVPCDAAVLPSGEIVVHVFVDEDLTVVHFVTPDYLNDDASTRAPFEGERLGGPDNAQSRN